MPVPASLSAGATRVGEQRVYGADGSHGACTSYALPVDFHLAAAQLEAEYGPRTSPTTDSTPRWRVTRKSHDATWISLIELYDGRQASVPGFEQDLVPQGTRCILVLTEMHSSRTRVAAAGSWWGGLVRGLVHGLVRRRR